MQFEGFFTESNFVTRMIELLTLICKSRSIQKVLFYESHDAKIRFLENSKCSPMFYIFHSVSALCDIKEGWFPCVIIILKEEQAKKKGK